MHLPKPTVRQQKKRPEGRFRLLTKPPEIGGFVAFGVRYDFDMLKEPTPTQYELIFVTLEDLLPGKLAAGFGEGTRVLALILDSPH